MSLRRTPPPRRRPPGASTFPIVPVIIAVVAVGFAIGAAIPALRGSSHGTARVALASPSPASLVTPLATLAPATEPPTRPPATASPTQPATQAPASPSPAATQPGSPTPSATPSVAAKPSHPPAIAVTPHPRPRATATTRLLGMATPRAVPSAAAPATPARIAPTPLASGAENAIDLENLAAATVRRYLEALIAGNESDARALLDAPSGSADAALGEESFVDRATQIVDVRPRATSADDAVVEVDLQTSKGAYFDRFQVQRNQNGVVIREHSFIKP